ncbi:MAG TPA: hypothetical protein VIS51_02390 [Solirubrobacterales bacterium]
MLTPETPGEIKQGVTSRISETLDSTSKALGAVAGLGVFFFAVGYLVEWQRMKRGGLPPEQVLPLLPKAQVAAAGVRELTISILLGCAIMAVLVLGLVGLVRLTENKKGRCARKLNGFLEDEVIAPTVVIGSITVLVVPFDVLGLIVAATVTGLLYYGLHLVSDFLDADKGAKFPLWRLTLAIAVAAVVLIGIRQHEFPEPRPVAIAVLNDGTKLRVAYIASDSDKVLLRRQHHGRTTELIVVHVDDLKSLRVLKSSHRFPLNRSILGEMVSLVGPDFRLSCIPPECRWENGVRIGPSLLF